MDSNMPDGPTGNTLDKLIDNPVQAIENIRRYQTELDGSSALVERMRRARHWYAVKSDGRWLFAPSKFVGYAENTARVYLERAKPRNGLYTEKRLKRWFENAPPDVGAELSEALLMFLKEHGHSGLGKKTSVNVLKEAFASTATTSKILDRIAIDAAVCGGRPHIRGTRVRVSDILELLAEGVPRSAILADYPYLNEADLRAALAYGAAVSEHRIIPAT